MKIAGNKRMGIKSFTAIIILVLMVLSACTAQPTVEAEPVSTATLIQPTQTLIPTETATTSPTEAPTLSPPIAGPDTAYPTEIEITQTFDADVFAQQEQDFQTEILPKEDLGAKKIMEAYQALADNVTTQIGDVITIHGLYEKATRNWNIFAVNSTTGQAMAVYLNGQIVIDFGGAVEIFKSKDLTGLTLEYLPPPAFASVSPDDPAVPQFVASYGISQHNKWNILHAYDVDGNEIAWLNTTLNNGTWVDSNTGAPLPKFEPKGKVAGRFELPTMPLTATGEFDFENYDIWPGIDKKDVNTSNLQQWLQYYTDFFNARFPVPTGPMQKMMVRWGGFNANEAQLTFGIPVSEQGNDLPLLTKVLAGVKLPVLENKQTGKANHDMAGVYFVRVNTNNGPRVIRVGYSAVYLGYANESGDRKALNISRFFALDAFSFESLSLPQNQITSQNVWKRVKNLYEVGIYSEDDLRAIFELVTTKVDNNGQDLFPDIVAIQDVPFFLGSTTFINDAPSP
jgi:hypothetical protein